MEMTLDDRIADAHARSTRIYLERQQVEAARQQAQLRAQQLDLQLVKLDGEIEVLEALKAEQARPAAIERVR